MPLAALLVHELRFQLTCGHGSACAQGRDGLSILIPLVIALAAMAIGRSIARASTRRHAFGLGVVVLLGLHGAQSGVEHLLPWHEAGLLSSGGWVALPLAIAASGVVALTCSAGRAVARMFRGTLRTPRARREPGRRWGRGRAPVACRIAVTGFRVDRGPPALALCSRG
jgi:hypothetical protein